MILLSHNKTTFFNRNKLPKMKFFFLLFDVYYKIDIYTINFYFIFRLSKLYIAIEINLELNS